MKRFLALIAGGFLALALFTTLITPSKSEPGYVTDRGYWQLAVDAEDAQATAGARQTSITLWQLLPPLGLLALLVFAIYTVAADRAEQRRRYHADQNGHYPLPSMQAISQELGKEIAVHLTAALYAGQMQSSIARHTLPPTLIMDKHAGMAPAALPMPSGETIAALPGLPTAPSFAQLLAQGFSATSQRMLLGYGAGGPIYGGIDSLLSTAIAGRPGQGKSTALRFVYAQCLQAGGQVAILDPHGSLLGDVQGAPYALYASDAAELDEAAAWLQSELDQRLALFKAGQRQFTPLLVLADEWPVISLKSEHATTAAGRLILEGRKVGTYALISGQGLPAGQFGGSLVRDALSSRYVFRTAPAQARIAGLDKEAARLCETLDIGRAVFAGPIDPAVVAIPQTTTLDLASLARTGAATPCETAQKEYADFVPSTRDSNDNNELLDNFSQPAGGDVAELLRRLKSAGLGKVKTLEAVYGVRPGSNDRYREVSRIYDDAIGGAI